MSSSNLERILFIQTAFLGDVILMTACISEARRLFPHAMIDVVVKKGNESLLENNPHIRKVFTFDKKNGKINAIKNLTTQLRQQSYCIAFNFHRFGSSGIITLLSGAKKKYGFKKNPFSLFFTKKFPHQIGNGTHEVTRNLLLLKEFGARNLVRPELYPSKTSFEKTQQYKNQTYYCMAPASVWFTKQLPEKKWVELIVQKKEDQIIYLIGGPSDFDLCERVRLAVNRKNCFNLCGQLSLLDTAALMKDAKRNYVNDSGPLHIASAMNAPVTAFFCSTVPKFGFGPLSDDRRILEKNDLACRPCGLHGHRSCPKDDFQCGEIDLEQEFL